MLFQPILGEPLWNDENTTFHDSQLSIIVAAPFAIDK